MRQCPPGAVELLHEQRLFDMILPRKYGGLEESIPTMARVLEELAIADGSIGWVVGIANGTSIIAANGCPSKSRARCSRRAPSPAAPRRRTDALRPSTAAIASPAAGRSPAAARTAPCSSAAASSWTATRHARRGGLPEYRMAVFPIERRRDHRHMARHRPPRHGQPRHEGRRRLRARRAHDRDGRRRTIDGPNYRYPPLGFLALTISPIPLGIARRAIDELARARRGQDADGHRLEAARTPEHADGDRPRRGNSPIRPRVDVRGHGRDLGQGRARRGDHAARSRRRPHGLRPRRARVDPRHRHRLRAWRRHRDLRDERPAALHARRPHGRAARACSPRRTTSPPAARCSASTSDRWCSPCHLPPPLSHPYPIYNRTRSMPAAARSSPGAASTSRRRPSHSSCIAPRPTSSPLSSVRRSGRSASRTPASR